MAILPTPSVTARGQEATVQAAVAAALGGDGGSSVRAGVDVLGTRALFDLITSFMVGYPYAVHKFYRESDARRVLTRSHRRVGYLAREGVLLHLAIATNNPGMLRLLYKLAKHPQYSQDPKLRLNSVMRCAVLYNQVEMLECINQLNSSTTSDREIRWEPDLMRIALHRDDPSIQVLDWLYAQLSRKEYPIGGNDLRLHVERGDLEVVQWLRERRCSKITQRLVDEAAIRRHAHVLEYLYRTSGKRCGSKAVDHVTKDSSLDVLNLIFAKQKSDMRGYALSRGASYGQIEVVRLIIESNPELAAWSSAIDYAATNGHLEVVKYLHEKSTAGCTTRAMSAAATHGHLDVVKFLHENRTEGCNPDTLERAVRNGHLEVVKFLLEKYNLECSQAAINQAVIYRHIDVVEYLLRDRNGD